MNTPRDRRKMAAYLDPPVLAEIRAEALRQDRSISWLAQQAWRIARARIKEAPDVRMAHLLP